MPRLPLIHIDSPSVLVDEAVPLRVDGLVPGTMVTVRARSSDPSGTTFSSIGYFVASAEGSIGPMSSSHGGSYYGSDSLGLWSRMSSGDERTFGSSLKPVPTTIEVFAQGRRLAAVRIARCRIAPNVTVEPVRSSVATGLLFTPQCTPAPAVVILGGSGGGLAWSREIGALLASHGYMTLALAYFGLPGLPPTLAMISLEYVHRAIDWLLSRSAALDQGVRIVGSSRGGELAMLVASSCNLVRAVVGFSSSAFAWAGSSRTVNVPAWTLGGRPVPTLYLERGSVSRAMQAPRIVMRPVIEAAMQDAPADMTGVIPVEQIAGPILLFSGSEDQVWPSGMFGELISARRTLHGQGGVTHVCFDSAGHAIGTAPALPPATPWAEHPVDGRTYCLGGTLRGNAEANARSWLAMLDFLRFSLQAPEISTANNQDRQGHGDNRQACVDRPPPDLS